MNTADGGLAPAVRSILATAAERPGGDERLAVDARSLPDAFADAEADGRIPVIAEVKPTSPTTDGERTDDPVELAEEMVAGGAGALSVLTEPEHFGGSAETLERVRDAVDVPVLRKDFLLREEQLDAVAADLVLLIVRFVGDDLTNLVSAARERGFQPLVEVHDADELSAAIDAGADLIGVNNRDLGALEVDLSTFERVAPEVPDDATLIAESGITTTADARRMREAGADGLLIGSAIMDAEGRGESGDGVEGDGAGGDVRANTRRFTRAGTEGKP
ncbi:indole-3-glycerol-phosphate synthase [Halorarum halophilum]|uniref:Indole-3-glycerol phosphate synthase n=1 Tax=Halorarum halophilum TaxID=2743090 RepID=A0A7D5KBU7_9EURY|nr:indole-3-glycerol phosphate synthase [Halobaculum halophilum]QLG26217.1 indole-3-glycerol-phosphate synthase [Halobaculum halophilum]